MEISIGGITTHYKILGRGKQDILLLHGWAASSDTYAHIIRHLEDRFRLIAVDFPGCGKSALPKAPLTLADYADFVLKFMQGIGVKDPIFIGHSHGGRVILYLAGNRMISPRKIILFDSAGIQPRKTLRQKIRLYTYKTIRVTLTLPLVRRFTKSLLEKARTHFGSADYKSAPEVMRKTLVNVVNTDLRDIMPNIAASTLLIWGAQDAATPPSDAAEMDRLIPDSGLCLIEHAGHFSFLDQPGQCHSILDSFIGEDAQP